MKILGIKPCATLSLLFMTFYNVHSQETQVECQVQPWERIITDQEIIESETGVSVDYSYNETKSSVFYSDDDNSTISAPGCPKSIDGTPWVQYGDPPKCYVPGYRGPCEYYEVLLQESPNSNKAACACLTIVDENLDSLERSDDGKYVFNKHKDFGIYDPDTKKCYDLYSQGPCETGHVFIRLANSKTLKCVPTFYGRCTFNLETQACEKLNPPAFFETADDLDSSASPSRTRTLPQKCNDKERYNGSPRKCMKNGSLQGVSKGWSA